MGAWGAWSYVPVALWLVLGLVGMSLQYRGRREPVEAAREQRAEA